MMHGCKPLKVDVNVDIGSVEAKLTQHRFHYYTYNLFDDSQNGEIDFNRLLLLPLRFQTSILVSGIEMRDTVGVLVSGSTFSLRNLLFNPRKIN